MNIFKRIGKTALDAESSTLNYITPKVVKNKLRDFTNWLYDYVESTNLDKVLNETKDYIQSTFKEKDQGLKEFDFDDELFRTDNISIDNAFIIRQEGERHIKNLVLLRLLFLYKVEVDRKP